MATIGSRCGSGKAVLGTVAIAIASATALISCSAWQPSDVNPMTDSTLHESPAPIVRAPLSDPLGYASSPEAPLPYPRAVSHGSWQASPRWAAVKGDGCIEVDQETEKTVRAGKFRVSKCSKDDAAHLLIDE